ncbi:hypothetical protein [Thioalkalivibrio sp. ALM2T]|uniref:hypothetical protein n=1 Tax=Thioalkalivibrio sp. ALM2T TaxID=1158184 RepID=UPI000372CE1F|nr:hypothetical protein [Thioalkalivibrio sp. ALM2T]
MKLELERVLCADGMVGDDEQAGRRGIAEGEVVLAAVTEGAELLVPGARRQGARGFCRYKRLGLLPTVGVTSLERMVAALEGSERDLRHR